MATCPANRIGQHKIYDYYNRLKGIQVIPDLVSWKHQVQQLTANKVIVGWNHYTTPLQSLGVMGEVGRWLTYVTRGLNTNHGLFHKFLTFELKDVAADEVCSVSIEKQRDGLLFQLAKSEETVRDKVEGSIRHGVVKRSGSSEEYGFEGLLVNNLASALEVTEASQANAFYSLLFANCQHTVADWQKALVEKSVSLMFQVPGTDQSISIDDDAIVQVVERMYPEWELGLPLQFPGVRNPFAIEVSMPVEENKRYSQLRWKEQVYEALYKQLRHPITDQEANIKGRKTILSNLTKCKFRGSLSQVSQLTSPVIDQIAELWSSTFDIVVTLESLGVVIFSFQDKDENCDIEHDLDTMVNLASKIESIPKEAGKCIHLVILILDAKCDIQGNVEEQKYGCLLQIALTTSTLQSHIQLREIFASCMHSLFMRVMPAKKRQIYCQRFAAKLFLLQNMECESALIHKRIDSQEFGPAGFCIWTKEQSRIIHEARKAFVEGEQIRWIIHGCFGSGKTLLLMQMARDFVRVNKGRVFILIPPTRVYLKMRLEDALHFSSENVGHLQGDDVAVIPTKEEARIKIGNDISRVPEDVSLLLHDEFESTRTPQFAAGHLSHVVFHSASLKPRPKKHAELNVKCYELSGNLRCSKPISLFIRNFQKSILTKKAHVHAYININEAKLQRKRQSRARHFTGESLAYPISTALESRLSYLGEEPSVTRCMDTSSNRGILLDVSTNTIMELEKKHKEVMVSCFMHYTLKTKLIDQMHKRIDGGHIIFPSSLEAHGCQFPAVLLIIDKENFCANPEEIVSVMSRATLSLRVILNDIGICGDGKSNREIIKFFSNEEWNCASEEEELDDSDEDLFAAWSVDSDSCSYEEPEWQVDSDKYEEPVEGWLEAGTNITVPGRPLPPAPLPNTSPPPIPSRPNQRCCIIA